MTRKPPQFWYSQKGASQVLAVMMTPLSWLWQLVTGLRWRLAKPYQSSLPVICIGNLTVGGVGKTPCVRTLALAAKAKGFTPVILMRGYGGRLAGPLFVNDQHSAHDVGDEALELKATLALPVVVSRDRAAGARWIETHHAGDVIIMDDGFQNPTLRYDQAVLVFDGETGIGNSGIVPSGPLRESLPTGLRRASHALIIGEDKHQLANRIHHLAPHIPRASAQKGYHTKTRQMITDQTTCNGRLLAFAGIGRPQGFFDTIQDHGGHLVTSLSFGDHHHYSAKEWEHIIRMAETNQARLVTTMKDYMRLSPSQKAMVTPLPLELRIDDEKWITQLLAGLDKD